MIPQTFIKVDPRLYNDRISFGLHYLYFMWLLGFTNKKRKKEKKEKKRKGFCWPGFPSLVITRCTETVIPSQHFWKWHGCNRKPCLNVAWSFVLLLAHREEGSSCIWIMMFQIYPLNKLGFDPTKSSYNNQSFVQSLSNEWSLRGKSHIVHSFMFNSSPAQWKGWYGLLNKSNMKEDWCSYK